MWVNDAFVIFAGAEQRKWTKLSHHILSRKRSHWPQNEQILGDRNFEILRFHNWLKESGDPFSHLYGDL